MECWAACGADSRSSKVDVVMWTLGRIFGTGALLCVSAATSASTTSPAIVSQKGRMFLPGEVTIAKGDAIEIVNDDGDILHHAYVDSPEFSFDSGDQKPGSHTLIYFPVTGTFMVLCGIHPKMKLAITVK